MTTCTTFIKTVILATCLLVASAGTSLGQTGTIEGTITEDASGNALPGVNVVVTETGQGAATGTDGRYVIQDVDPGTYTLEASFIGFGEEIREGVVVEVGETTVVDIAMRPRELGLDEVVVVGYGEVQKRDLTGAVSSITPSDIQRLPVTSVDQVLQGMAPGVHVTTSSSAPGGGISVRIRGAGSITSGAEPLFVIDGMPIYNDLEAVPGVGGLDVGPNPLAALNLGEIESIQVLKDASATAIYGARGANGVVLITTKQGTPGRTSVDFTSSIGVQEVANTYEVLNAEQFVQFTNEAAINRGESPPFDGSPSSYGAGTDWQDIVYGPAVQQNYQLGLTGGNSTTRYAASGNYFDDGGVINNSGFSRYSFRLNFGHDVSDRFSVSTNLMASRALYSLVDEGGIGIEAGVSGTAAKFVPVATPYGENGAYTDQTRVLTYGVLPLENPIAFTNERDDRTDINRLLGNAVGILDITNDLSLHVSVGVDTEEMSRQLYQTRALIMLLQDGSAQTWDRSRLNILNENLLRFDRTFAGVHDLDVTAGFTMQEESTEFRYLQNGDFVTDITKNDDIGAGSQPGGPTVSSGYDDWGLLSWLGRVNYIFADRYLFTVTARADGSSKFGTGNKWGFFPSGAIAWRVSEESFMQNQTIVSDLKIRASYGMAGNQEIGSYSSLARMTTREYFYNDRQVIGYIPASVANPNLKWETSRQLDIGLDVSFLNHRIRLTTDFYRKITEDLILPVTLPYSTGFDSAIKNTGSIMNTGIEFGLNTDFFSGPFSWSTGTNFSYNRNEVLDLGESDRFFGASTIPGHQIGSLVEEGRAIGLFWGYETNGVIADEAEAEALGYGAPGEIEYVDQNGDGVINTDDRTIIGSPHPDFVLGFTNTLRYGGLELSAFIQGVFGNEIFNANLEALELQDMASNSSLRRFEERWTPENKYDATYPKPGHGFGNETRRADTLIEDGTYIRLKTVTLSYSLPASWLQARVVRNARIYVQGRNLFTITDYYGLNPDVDSFGQGTINTGYDSGSYPLTRQYTVGVNLTF